MKGRTVFNGYWVSNVQYEKVVEIYFIIMQIYATLLNCTVKMDQIVNFVCVFNHSKKKKKKIEWTNDNRGDKGGNHCCETE